MKQVRATVLIGLAAALFWGAGGRRKLWDLDLSKFSDHRTDMAAQVWGIRFSPDETKVAIGFGPLWNFDPRPRHVVIVAVDQPQTALSKFELNISSPWPSEGNIVWSPSGTILVAKDRTPVMLRLGGGATCAFPKESEFGGFLSGDRMVIAFRDEAEIRILASDCSLIDSWVIDGPADVLDTSPEGDLLAIQTFLKPSERSSIELVAVRDHEVKQRWVWDSLSTFHGGFLFSDQGRLVCSAKSRAGKQGPDAACWDTQTGAKTAENNNVAVDWHGIASAGGDLLAITDSKYISHQGKLWVFLDMNNDYSVPRRQLLWNVRTGKEIASWGGGFYQTELWGRDLKRASKERTPFVLSLSPTGRYVAEGGLVPCQFMSFNHELRKAALKWIIQVPTGALPHSGANVCWAGQGTAAPCPTPPSPQLRPACASAPDRFLLTKPNTPRIIEVPASLRSDGVRVYPGMPFGFRPE